MNYKKFISSVSALAIAATTFTAMAVTASATDYNESVTLGAANGYNIASYNASGIATAKTGVTYAALRADLRELTDIADATSVTVEFDAATYSGNVVVFSFGDAAQRTVIADGSGNFKTGGLAMYFGSVNGSDLKAYDKKSGQSKSLGSAFFGKILHAKVRFNKAAGTYDYEISQGSNKISQTGVATDISNLTYVEAFTKTAGAQMMFNNITVSYTVPDAPAPATYSFDLTNADSVTGTDGSAVVVKNTVTGISSIDKITVVAEGRTKEFTEFDAPVIDGDTLIGIVVKGVSSVDSITIN
jgi:hypothetical protein